MDEGIRVQYGGMKVFGYKWATKQVAYHQKKKKLQS